MAVRERHIGVLAMVVASTLWGISSGVLAAVDTSPIWLLSIYGLVLGAPMLAWGLRVERPWQWRWVLALFAFDMVGIGGFFVALGLAPVGPAVALHLTSPVLILLYEIAARRTAVTAWRLCTLALILAGCALAAWSAGTSGGGPLALVGLALSLLSAVGVALINVLAVRLATRRENWQMVVGVASLGRGVICAALALAVGAMMTSDVTGVVAVATVAAVGVVLLWTVAAPRLSARTISVIALNEAVVATLVAVIAFGKPLGVPAALATAIILAAIALEVLEPSPAVEGTIPTGAAG